MKLGGDVSSRNRHSVARERYVVLLRSPPGHQAASAPFSCLPGNSNSIRIPGTELSFQTPQHAPIIISTQSTKNYPKQPRKWAISSVAEAAAFKHCEMHHDDAKTELSSTRTGTHSRTGLWLLPGYLVHELPSAGEV